jgi:branched-chain amino acid transport system ATP-binding protein
MNRPLLEVKNLYAGYREIPVLRNIQLEIHAGEIVALVGSNGAGKTTLLRALSRVIPCTGQIQFDGRELVDLTPDQVFSLGLVQIPEGRQLFDQMTVTDNLMMGAYVRNHKYRIQAAFEQVYSLFPILHERRGQLAGSLSGGEQQMCAIARGLMASPKLLAVDEMSLGLAPIMIDRLLKVLEEVRGTGVTILLVEQDVFAAFELADRAYVLENGSVVRAGSSAELAEDPKVQQAYLGL